MLNDDATPRLCHENGCDRELTPLQRKFCSERHAAAHRQRRRRRERLEERILGPQSEVDDLVLRVVDLESLEELVDEVAVRMPVYSDFDLAHYRGIETIRAVAEALKEAERRHIPQNVVARAMLA